MMFKLKEIGDEMKARIKPKSLCWKDKVGDFLLSYLDEVHEMLL